MQATQLTVKLPTTSDLAGTTEDVTFSPEQVSPELTTFVSRSSDGTILGTRRVSVRYSPATKQRNFAKGTMTVSNPKVGTVLSGAFGVIATPRVSIEVQIPEATDAIERARLQSLVTEMIDHELIAKALFQLDPIY